MEGATDRPRQQEIKEILLPEIKHKTTAQINQFYRPRAPGHHIA
jgi:hypothetical protein